MSEFSSSFQDSANRQNAYDEAVASAQGRGLKTEEELRKFQEAKEKAAAKDEKISTATTVLGAIPLEEGIKDLVSKSRKAAVKKVSSLTTDAIEDITNKVGDKVAQSIKGAVTRTRGLSKAQLPENLTRLPKADIKGAEDKLQRKARRKALRQLQAKTEREGGKFKPSQGIRDTMTDNSGDVLTSLRDAKSSASGPAATLGPNDVVDFDPTTFFDKTTGFDAGGDLTRRQINNPASIYNNQDALDGARDFQEYSTSAARRQAISDSISGKATSIARPPASTKSLIPDQLKPMRDSLAKKNRLDYDNAKSDARAKSNLPQQLTDEQKALLPDWEAVAKKPVVKTDALTEPEPTFDDISKLPPPSAALDPEADNIAAATKETATVKDTAKVGEDTAKVGESVGKDLVKGLEVGGEVDAEAGGPEDPVGDLLAVGAGLASVIGGLFHHHHHEKPPPPLPPVLNPAPALGI